jgi:Zn-finger nucleic acid-binding protein
MVLARDRDYFFCEYCGSFYLPEASSDRIRVLDESAGDVQCSVCGNPLCQASIGGYRGLHCQNCGGVLMDQSTFAEMVKYLRAGAVGPPDPPRPLNREELQRRIGCPYCGRTMATHPYYGPGSIVIDTCGRCGIIWLDYGELDIVIDAPGPDRGK